MLQWISGLNGIEPLYIIFTKINRLTGDNDGTKYLTLTSTEENKQTKKYEDMWYQIKYLIKSIHNKTLFQMTL